MKICVHERHCSTMIIIKRRVGLLERKVCRHCLFKYTGRTKYESAFSSYGLTFSSEILFILGTKNLLLWAISEISSSHKVGSLLMRMYTISLEQVKHSWKSILILFSTLYKAIHLEGTMANIKTPPMNSKALPEASYAWHSFVTNQFNHNQSNISNSR